MTSKNSWFSHQLLWDTFKKNLWLVSLAFLAFFFALPVATALNLQRFSKQMALNTDGVNKLVETTSRVMNPFSQSNIVVILLISGCAVVAAAAVFYYLHNRQRTDFYHSLPLSRTKLFTIHYGAGALLVLLPYLINLALTVLVVAANGYLSYLNAGDIFLSIGHHMLFFFAIYSMGVLSAILTGNWVTNLLLTTLFAVILPSFVGVYIMGMECFYQTFYLFGDLAQRLVCYLSPVTRYFTATSSSLMIKFPMGFLEYIIWLAVTIGLIAAALLLYKKRHSENAGAAIAFSWAKPLIKYPLILLFTLLGGMLFHAIGDDGDYQHWGWLIFGFFCGGIISSRIIEIVFAFDFRAIKANLKGLVLFTVLFAAFICIPIFDLTGYNDYVPEVGQIKAINISSYNLDGFDNDNDSYLYQSFYETRSEKDFLKARQLTDPANLTTGVELAQIAQQYTAAHLGTDTTTELELSPSQYMFANCSISLIYTLNSGRQVGRQYTRGLPSALLEPTMAALVGTQEYKENSYSILSLPEDQMLAQNIALFATDSIREFRPKDFTATEHLALVQALKQDALAMSPTTLQTRHAIGSMTFTLHKETSSAVLTQSNSEQNELWQKSFSVPIYDNFTHTLAKLSELAAISPSEFKLNPADVNYIEVAEMQNKEAITVDPAATTTAPTIAEDYVNIAEKANEHTTVVRDQAKIAALLAETSPETTYYFSSFSQRQYHPDHYLRVFLKDRSDSILYYYPFSEEQNSLQKK